MLLYLVDVKKLMQIENRKARFDYHIRDRYVAGVQLRGSEVKSIRDGQASIQEGFCRFRGEELYLYGMHVSEYFQASHNNHIPGRERKLLLHRKELKQLQRKVKERGYTIVPLKLFATERNLIKAEIALVQGKKQFDKRQTIQQKDAKREKDRAKKESNNYRN